MLLQFFFCDKLVGEYVRMCVEYLYRIGKDIKGLNENTSQQRCGT